VKKIIPRSVLIFRVNLLALLSVVKLAMRDVFVYVKYAQVLNKDLTVANIEASLIANCHSIERGLSLSNVRLRFGGANIDRIIQLLNIRLNMVNDKCDHIHRMAIGVLDAYINYHETKGVSLPELILKTRELSGPCAGAPVVNSGTKRILKSDWTVSQSSDFGVFARNRFSIRNFSSIPVENEVLYKAINLAQRAPSVCNRQSSRVYIVYGCALDKILAIHNGIRGFEQHIHKILVVTSEVQSFFGATERHQPFIDGGIFLMSLVYALQYYSVGTCTINWAVDIARDKQLKMSLGLPDSQEIIAMIVVGNVPDEFNVACSERLDTNEIIKTIN